MDCYTLSFYLETFNFPSNNRNACLTDHVNETGTDCKVFRAVSECKSGAYPQPTSVECRYNGVQYIMILLIAIQWPQQNNKSGFELTKDIPYLALPGEQWGVCCDEFTQNLSSYNDTISYQV